MNKALIIDQIEFAFAREKENIDRIDVQTLRDQAVISDDWKLLDSSYQNSEISLIALQNGIYILDQAELFACLEVVNCEESPGLEIEDIALRYLEKFSQESVQALGINIEGHIACANQDEARSQLLQTYSASSCQHETDQHLVQAVLNCIYKLDRGVLTLTTRNTELALSEKESVAVVKFSANFHHDLSQSSNDERLEQLKQLVGEWRADVNLYKDIVLDKFVGRQEQSSIDLSTP